MTISSCQVRAKNIKIKNKKLMQIFRLVIADFCILDKFKKKKKTQLRLLRSFYQEDSICSPVNVIIGETTEILKRSYLLQMNNQNH